MELNHGMGREHIMESGFLTDMNTISGVEDNTMAVEHLGQAMGLAMVSSTITTGQEEAITMAAMVGGTIEIVAAVITEEIVEEEVTTTEVVDEDHAMEGAKIFC